MRLAQGLALWIVLMVVLAVASTPGLVRAARDTAAADRLPEVIARADALLCPERPGLVCWSSGAGCLCASTPPKRAPR